MNALSTSKPTTANVSSAASGPESEFYQDGKKFLPIGDKKNIFVVADIFQKEVRVNIREFFVEDSECGSSSDNEDDTEQTTRPYFKATKRGVSLTITEFDRLCEKLEKAKGIVKRLSRKLKKKGMRDQRKRE